MDVRSVPVPVAPQVHDVVLQEYHIPSPVGLLDVLIYLLCFLIWKGEIRVLVIDNAFVDAGDSVIVQEPFFRIRAGFFTNPYCCA